MSFQPLEKRIIRVLKAAEGSEERKIGIKLVHITMTDVPLSVDLRTFFCQQLARNFENLRPGWKYPFGIIHEGEHMNYYSLECYHHDGSRGSIIFCAAKHEPYLYRPPKDRDSKECQWADKARSLIIELWQPHIRNVETPNLEKWFSTEMEIKA